MNTGGKMTHCNTDKITVIKCINIVCGLEL